MARRLELAEAKQKAGRFCAFQERSPKEISDKLRGWGLENDQVQDVLEQLLNEGFVDPQRFANAYCNDKFEFNSWGKHKIKANIFVHQLDAVVVENALARIDNDNYINRLAELAEKKWSNLEGVEDVNRKQKTLSYLTNKGFETDLIWKALNQLSKKG